MGYSSIAPSSTNIAQAVWSYGPRTLTDIQSLVNAIQNNNPNLLSMLGDLPFIPAPMYAGQVSLTQVASFISSLVQGYRAAGVIASFINSNPYSLWHFDFVTDLLQNPYLGFTNASLILNAASQSMLSNIATSTSVPVTSLLSFISNAALSGNAAQGLLYSLAENYYYNKWLQTVTYNAPSITFSTNATLSTNVLIAQEITVASGVTVTCGTHTCFFITRVFNNQGTIVNPYGAPGGGGGWGGAGGGAGGGGIVVIAYTAAMGTINVNGANGMAATTSPGCCCNSCTGQVAGGGAGGAFALLSGMSVPLGGNSVTFNAIPTPLGEPNGGAGSNSNTCCGEGGGGGSAAVQSFSNGNDLVTYVIQGISDWWLQNEVRKTPSSVMPLLFIYGSGGGAGGTAGCTGCYGGGGGGGGGGEVTIYGYNVIAGTTFANGGNGGEGSPDLLQSGGGGGGGGGTLLVFYGPGGLNGSIDFEAVGGSGGLFYTNYYASAGQSGTYYAGSVTVNG
jgi:hypothetical protein